MPHVFGDLQAGLDQPLGYRVRVVQQRRNQTRTGVSAQVRGSGEVARWLGPRQEGPTASARRRAHPQADPDLLEPEDAVDRRLLRAVDLRLREPHHSAARQRDPGCAAPQPHQRQTDEGGVVGELGRRPRRFPRDRAGGPDPAEGQRGGQTPARRDLHVLPPTDL